MEKLAIRSVDSSVEPFVNGREEGSEDVEEEEEEEEEDTVVLERGCSADG